MNNDRFRTDDTAREVVDDGTPSAYESNAARILEQLGQVPVSSADKPEGSA